MPIYMDRHIVPGIEAKHAAEAHREDLKIQHEFGCRCMTYWVDEERGSAFCLIDAPSKKAVRDMHAKAHGLVAHEIVQVNSHVVEAFMGRINDPDGYCDPMDEELRIFNDPAFRTILISAITNSRLLKHDLGKRKSEELLSLYHDIIREQLAIHEGSEVELGGEDYIISFVSVNQAVDCAIEVRKRLHVAGEIMNLRLGLNAGMPVTQSKTLFGDTVAMAKYLCWIGEPNQLLLASIIKEIYKDPTIQKGQRPQYLRWIAPENENFLQLLMETLSSHWQEPNLNVREISAKMFISKSKLYRKCTQIAGLSTNELLRKYRLYKALDLLISGRNITQTSFDAGFASPSYFTKCFVKEFGLLPLEYQRL